MSEFFQALEAHPWAALGTVGAIVLILEAVRGKR